MIKQKFQPNLSSMYKHFLFFECYKKTNDHRTIIKNPFSSLALIDNTILKRDFVQPKLYELESGYATFHGQKDFMKESL